MRADTGRIVARIEESCQDDTFADSERNVSRGDMGTGRRQADRNGVVERSDGIQVVCTIGQCFHGAERTIEGSVVHGAASLAILLVVQIEADRIGVTKLGKGTAVGENEALLEKSNVLSPELDGACFGTS
jgi:hypothetical protein